MRLRLLPASLCVFALTGLVLTASGASVGTGGLRAVARARTAASPVVLVYEKAVAGNPSAPAWIWKANADASHPLRLRHGHTPIISPDGRTVAFTRTRQVTSGGTTSTVAALWLMRSDGSHARRITRTAGGFGPIAWSPDSRRLVVGARDGWLLISRAQNTGRLLPGTESSSTSGVEQASFAPDGEAIAYDRFDATGADVFALSLTDGQHPVQLTHDHESFWPLWGPSKMAYQRGFIHGDIWLMNGDGGQNARLTRTAAGYYPAAWSQDGRRLLGANPANHNGRLWAVEVPNGRAKALTRWVGDLFPQGLSRNGRIVYAGVGCGGTHSPFGRLEAIPFSGGSPKVIVRGPCQGSWSA